MRNIQTKHIIISIIAIIICYFGYRSYRSMENSRTKTDYLNNNNLSVKPKIPIEDYFEYSIIRKNEIGTEKLSLDIRIKKEYNKSELEEFAHYIKDNYSTKSCLLYTSDAADDLLCVD